MYILPIRVQGAEYLVNMRKTWKKNMVLDICSPSCTKCNITAQPMAQAPSLHGYEGVWAPDYGAECAGGCGEGGEHFSQN